MNLLLDTPAFLWSLEQPRKLSSAAKRAIRDVGNTILVSAVVAWELSIKAKAGRLDLKNLLFDFSSVLVERSFLEMEITLDHGIRAGLLPLHHKDPFDRMLVAQAQSESLFILSCDEVFDLYGIQRVW